MPSAFLRAKVDERAALTDLVSGILDKCSTETRDPSAEERAKLDEYGNRIKVLDGSITELRTAEEANSRFLNIATALEAPEEQAEAAAARRKTPPPVERMSLGEAFVKSDQFKSYRGFGTMEPVTFDDFLGVEQRMAAITGPITEAVLGIPPQQWVGPAGGFQRTPFLSVIGREVTSVNSVTYITWSDATGAGVVAETDTKPEAALTPTETPVNLQTYAFWKAITRQALEDQPRIRSIVETKLRTGLAQTLEAAAVQTLAGLPAPAVGSSFGVEGIRTAIGALQAKGYTPTAVVANPADAAALDIDAMSQLSGPTAPNSYWGLPVLAVPGVTAGTIYVGDWSQAVTWFDRSSASVYMSDSHADYFIRNLFVVLAEERSAFALTQPDAAQAVSMTAVAALAAK